MLSRAPLSVDEMEKSAGERRGAAEQRLNQVTAALRKPNEEEKQTRVTGRETKSDRSQIGIAAL